MLRIALTGGIASGKTTVANLFAELGVPIIDTDKIARELMDNTEVKQKVADYFGTQIVDENNQIIRSELRKVIFDNAEHRKWLESLLHPRIRENVEQQIKSLKSKYCIIVIPLLNKENKKHYLVDRVIVVDCPREQQIKRVMQRDNINESLASKMIDSQLDRKSRLELADDVITNDENVTKLEKEIQKLHQKYNTK